MWKCGFMSFVWIENWYFSNVLVCLVFAKMALECRTSTTGKDIHPFGLGETLSWEILFGAVGWEGDGVCLQCVYVYVCLRRKCEKLSVPLDRPLMNPPGLRVPSLTAANFTWHCPRQRWTRPGNHSAHISLNQDMPLLWCPHIHTQTDSHTRKDTT